MIEGGEGIGVRIMVVMVAGDISFDFFAFLSLFRIWKPVFIYSFIFFLLVSFTLISCPLFFIFRFFFCSRFTFFFLCNFIFIFFLIFFLVLHWTFVIVVIIQRGNFFFFLSFFPYLISSQFSFSSAYSLFKLKLPTKLKPFFSFIFFYLPFLSHSFLFHFFKITSQYFLCSFFLFHLYSACSSIFLYLKKVTSLISLS